ncbi:MAG: hypothetical protein ACP5SJ_02990 [Candidatus Micrarchaeia archaeon]
MLYKTIKSSAAKRSARSQAALDFMVSYGIAIMIITIALYIIFSLGVFNPKLASQQCTPSPSFICLSYSINKTSSFSIILSQSTGGTMYITGVACSSAVNSTSNIPAYGNVHVLPYSLAPQYYPNNALQNGAYLYSDNETLLQVFCYNSKGKAASSLGYTFTGYLWINYTFSNLPSVHYISKVASFTASYT